MANKTYEEWLAEVRHSGFALRFVPEESKTLELCFEAVRQGCGRALEFVGEQFKTPELCLLAIRQDASALEFVPEYLQTEELCLEAIRKDAAALQWIYNMTPALYEAAMLEAGMVWDLLPSGYKRAVIHSEYDLEDYNARSLCQGFWVAASGSPCYTLDTDHDTYVSQYPELFNLSCGVPLSECSALFEGWIRVRVTPAGIDINLISNASPLSPQARVSNALSAIEQQGVPLSNGEAPSVAILVGIDDHSSISLTLAAALAGE